MFIALSFEMIALSTPSRFIRTLEATLHKQVYKSTKASMYLIGLCIIAQGDQYSGESHLRSTGEVCGEYCFYSSCRAMIGPSVQACDWLKFGPAAWSN